MLTAHPFAFVSGIIVPVECPSDALGDVTGGGSYSQTSRDHEVEHVVPVLVACVREALRLDEALPPEAALECFGEAKDVHHNLNACAVMMRRQGDAGRGRRWPAATGSR